MASLWRTYTADFLRACRTATNPLLPQEKSLLREGGLLKSLCRPRGCKGGKNRIRRIETVVGNRPSPPGENPFICKSPRRNQNRSAYLHTCERESQPRLVKPNLDKPPKPKSMPSLLLANARSLVNKLDEFSLTLSVNQTHIAAVTETWFTTDLPEEATSIEGYNLFHKDRCDKRGGGVALYIKNCIEAKLVDVGMVGMHDNFECIWTQLQPHWTPRAILIIYLGILYHPPSANDRHLQYETCQYLIHALDELQKKTPNAVIIFLCGDFNNLPLQPLLTNHPEMKQVVTKPTRGDATLDLIITNTYNHYHEPEIVAPLANSDHNCIIWKPKVSKPANNKILKKRVRPLRQSDLRAFGSWITNHQWEEVFSAARVNDKCSAFYATLLGAVNRYFPIKTVRLHIQDKPWVTPQLKTMIKERQKAFTEDDLTKWKCLRNKINHTIRSLKKSHYKTKVKHLKSAEPKKWYKAIKDKKGELRIEVPGVPSSSPKAVADAINSHLAAAS
ncbi:Hypp4516 [Branchiostoma lanceolatum]|uniref:Hypp4516 protein n=1 Tax=Branchiostoma lanceolatum TaxID=7740 RepID=A0A8K0ADW6_BRALA|nr:Hypp4516 [Branchiostoma lanceolatum]